MTPPEPISLARRLSLLGKQSLVYGLGSVVSRFASLLLLPVYAAYLNPGDYGRVENLTALVAVAATISQLGMVNALFRFALERTGDARWAVVRTAIALLRLHRRDRGDRRRAADAAGGLGDPAGRPHRALAGLVRRAVGRAGLRARRSACTGSSSGRPGS